jgi:integrase
MAIRAVARFDDVPADKFGPIMLMELMHSMVGKPGRRKGADGKQLPIPRVTINDSIKQIRRMFRWAVSRELVPAAIANALDTVDLLRLGRTAAPELPKVKAVSDHIVAETLRHLTLVVANMVRVQRLIGCRPGELCRMTPQEITRGGNEWEWRPNHHKTSWRGEARVIAIGPRAQAILLPYLDRHAESPCFTPAESEAERNTTRRRLRASPMTPTHRARRERFRRRKRVLKPYDQKAYCRVIARVCDKHGIPRWSPNQLRHTAAEEVRRHDGLDAAQAMLGHKHAKVTEVYASLSLDKAKKVANKHG